MAEAHLETDILMLMASVDDALAAELEDAARHWGMDALIEVHDRAELDRALRRSPLIGVNNAAICAASRSAFRRRWTLRRMYPPTAIWSAKAGCSRPPT